jgi:hypothetical protein
MQDSYFLKLTISMINFFVVESLDFVIYSSILFVMCLFIFGVACHSLRFRKWFEPIHERIQLALAILKDDKDTHEFITKHKLLKEEKCEKDKKWYYTLKETIIEGYKNNKISTMAFEVCLQLFTRIETHKPEFFSVSYSDHIETLNKFVLENKLIN